MKKKDFIEKLEYFAAYDEHSNCYRIIANNLLLDDSIVGVAQLSFLRQNYSDILSFEKVGGGHNALFSPKGSPKSSRKYNGFLGVLDLLSGDFNEDSFLDDDAYYQEENDRKQKAWDSYIWPDVSLTIAKMANSEARKNGLDLEFDFDDLCNYLDVKEEEIENSVKGVLLDNGFFDGQYDENYCLYDFSKELNAILARKYWRKLASNKEVSP